MLGDSDKYAPAVRKRTPMQWDKAQAVANDRTRDAPPFYPGRSWVTECEAGAMAATTDEDRKYFIGEIETISQGAADEVRRILKEGW